MANKIGIVKMMEGFETYNYDEADELEKRLLADGSSKESAFKSKAGTVAVIKFGYNLVSELPILVNFAALWISSKPKTKVHEVTAAVSRMVASTDMHDYPFMCPDLMKNAFVIESKNHEEPLFGDTFSIGGYWVLDKLFLVGTRYPDGALMGVAVPVWDGSEISGPDPKDPLMGEISRDEYTNWVREAVRYAIIFSRLMSADKTPLKSEPKGANTKRGRRGEATGWIVSRVYLDRKYGSASSGTGGEKMDKEGKLTKVVQVQGFLRNQAYGPGWKLHKDVWIESFETRRWVSARPTKIIVSA
jgi:hypothetical protein